MKTNLLFLAVASAAATAGALETAVPEPFAEDRYQPMIASSPFALATPIAAPVVADKSFADGWYLSGVSEFDGLPYITVRSNPPGEVIVLHGTEKENENGIKLHAVEWSKEYGKTTATIVKGGQYAKLEMLQSTDQSSAPPNPQGNPATARAVPSPLGRPPGAFPQPGGPQPQRIPQPNNQAARIPQPNVPGQARIPRPAGQQPIIQQPSYPQAMRPNAAPVPNNSTNEPRRRIRMIPSPTGQ